MKKYLILVSMLFLFVNLDSNSFSQSQTAFWEIEEKVVNIKNTFLQYPDRLTIGEIENVINELESLTLIEPIDIFKKKYYHAYMNYFLGLKAKNLDYFSLSKNLFIDTAKFYKKNSIKIALPKHQVFSNYMKSWCELQSFFISDNLGYLDDAISNLDTLEKDAQNSFIKDDTAFLKGYCYFLKVNKQFSDLSIDTTSINKAKEIFKDFHEIESIQMKDIGSYFYHLALYLDSQLASLEILLNKSPHLDLNQRIDNFNFGMNYFDSLSATNDQNIKNIATKNYNLAKLQWSVSKKDSVSELATLSDKNMNSLMDIYKSSLNFMLGYKANAIQTKNDSLKYKFWADLQTYYGYLENPRANVNVIKNIFMIDSNAANDWRINYLKDQAVFLKNESNLLRNQYNVVDADTTFLLRTNEDIWLSDCFTSIQWDSLILKNKLLSNIVNLKNEFGSRDITNWQVVEVMSSNPSLLENVVHRTFRNEFRLRPYEQKIYQMADYLLTLGIRNKSLLAPAYLFFSYLESQDYQAEKMRFLKLFCLYQTGDNDRLDAALSILNDNYIQSFRSENLKNEAHFYLGSIYKKRYGIRHNGVTDSYDEIIDIDPRAAFNIYYGIDPPNPDREGVCQVINQTREKECLQWLYNEAENVRKQQGWSCGGTSAKTVQIGENDIRLDLLERRLDVKFKNNYLAADKQFLLTFWQVFSSSPDILYPDRKTMLKGPAEFYLETEMDVVLTLGMPQLQKKIWIVEGNEATTVTTSEATYKTTLKSSKPYKIISAVEGYYPAIIENCLITKNGQIIQFQYDKAQKINRLETTELPDFTVVKFTEKFALATHKYLPYFSIANRKSENLQVKFDKPGMYGTFSAFTKLKGNYYLANQNLSNIFVYKGDDKLDEFGQSKFKNVLKNPGDIEVLGDTLIIVNNGHKNFLVFDVNRDRIVKTVKFTNFNKIESLAFLKSKVRKDTRVFAVDLEQNTLWVGNGYLSQFNEVCGVEAAKIAGMTAPTNIVIYNQKYFYVSDIVANKIYLFHKSGDFLKAFTAPSLYSLRALEIGGQFITVTQDKGIVTYSLVDETGYNFIPTCFTEIESQLSRTIKEFDSSIF